jgi:hypothetical protein
VVAALPRSACVDNMSSPRNTTQAAASTKHSLQRVAPAVCGCETGRSHFANPANKPLVSSPAAREGSSAVPPVDVATKVSSSQLPLQPAALPALDQVEDEAHLAHDERSKERRMLRNRESAARSRDKRKSRNASLESSIATLCQRSDNLESLQGELLILRNVMKSALGNET